MYHLLSPQSREPAPAPKRETGSLQTANSSAALGNEPVELSDDANRLQSLRLQFALAGLSLATTAGDDLIVTGRGLCLMADPRTATLLLRSLNRGQA